MEEKRRAVGIVRAAAIHGDLIRDAELIKVLARIGGPRIAACVKDDLSRILDLLDQLSSMTAVGVLELNQVVVGAPRFFEAHDILFQEILDFVVYRIVARMLGLEPGRICRRHLLAEVRSWKTGCGTRVRASLGMMFHPSLHLDDTTYASYNMFATTR